MLDSLDVKTPDSRRNAGIEIPEQELPVLAGEVDVILEKGFRRMRFPARLEGLFERETGKARAHHLIIGGLVSILLYNLFLIPDFLMIPDVFKTALFIHFGIITPMTVLIVIALSRGVPALVRENIQLAVTVCTGAGVIYLLNASRDPKAIYYHAVLLLIITFGNLVIQLRFWYAVEASLLIGAIYIFFYPFSPGVPAVVQLNNITILFTGIGFTLFANYRLEQDQRRSYLLNLRERIQRAVLAVKNTKLAELSHIDPLTAIPNRLELTEYLDRLVQQPQSNVLGIVMSDLDHFKLYNDLYGHPAGDECLRGIAGVMLNSLRNSGDMVARFGGEEFVAILPGADLHGTELVAERIRRAVQTLAIPHAASPVMDCVTISAGVAAGSFKTANDVQAILAGADAALYRAKSAGRNCVRQ
ncbi:MAG: GGDEF domain-containing protein [Anaerolineaceae bacterium]|nr:GGDEF domain-containing protein [Anaerolineaceae bacterium]